MGIAREQGGRVAGIGVAIGLLLAAAPGSAASEDVFVPPGETACAFGAWLNGDGNRDVAVHAAPSHQAETIGTLPVAAAGDAAFEYAVNFEVVAARDGWVKIAQASDRYNIDNGAPVRHVYDGEGWIPSERVGIQIQSGRGHVRPSTDSRRVIDRPGDWVLDFADIEHILGCERDWILVELAVGPRRDANGSDIPPETRESVRSRAWFRGICPLQETTCDMQSVDDDPPK